MKDLATIIAENSVTDLHPPTTEQEAVMLRHELVRANARARKIRRLLNEWKGAK